jgi:hypothetical protein
MTQIFGWFIAVCVGLIVIVNSLYMLISPRSWFSLPRWIRAAGTLPEDKFSAGWGGLQVRVTGALFLVVIGWVLYDSILKPR